MFNSDILDVAIGMIFIYLLLSLMCTAANEIIELMLKKRAIDLERGIRELLVPGSRSGTKDIVQKLYDHALINNLFGGHYLESRIKTGWPQWLRFKRTLLPSYIPASNFALALMDLVGTVPPDDAQPAKRLEGAGSPAASPTLRSEGADSAEALPDSLLTEPLSGAAGATVSPPASVSPAQFVVNLAPTESGGIPLRILAARENLPQRPVGNVDNRSSSCAMQSAIVHFFQRFHDGLLSRVWMPLGMIWRKPEKTSRIGSTVRWTEFPAGTSDEPR